LEPALGLSGQPVKRGTMAHEHIVYMMLVDAAAKARDEPAILKYAPLLEELAVRDDHQPYLAIAYRAFGIAHRLAGEYDQAEKRFLQALKIFESIGTTWQIGRTLAELGELAVRRDQNESAQEFFQGALSAFEKIQANPDIDKVKAVMDKIKKNNN
jgi:tetratricopeptide (TPR) repeat protein